MFRIFENPTRIYIMKPTQRTFGPAYFLGDRGCSLVQWKLVSQVPMCIGFAICKVETKV